MFATKSFGPGELIELCPLLLLESSTYASSPALADHLVSVQSSISPVALPLGYGALYNHGDAPNASWTVNGETALMEVRACKRIMPDDEILIDYGRLFFESRGIPKRVSTLAQTGM